MYDLLLEGGQGIYTHAPPLAALDLEKPNIVLVDGYLGPMFDGMYGEFHWGQEEEVRYIVKKEENFG